MAKRNRKHDAVAEKIERYKKELTEAMRHCELHRRKWQAISDSIGEKAKGMHEQINEAINQVLDEWQEAIDKADWRRAGYATADLVRLYNHLRRLGGAGIDLD